MTSKNLNSMPSSLLPTRHNDYINRDLLARINSSGRFHMTPAKVGGKYIIRFCVTYEHATAEHIGKRADATITRHRHVSSSIPSTWPRP